MQDARQTGDERGDVRVEDGPERAVVTGVDRLARREPQRELFTHALVDQHVRVDRDTERQHEAGDALLAAWSLAAGNDDMGQHGVVGQKGFELVFRPAACEGLRVQQGAERGILGTREANLEAAATEQAGQQQRLGSAAASCGVALAFLM